MNADRNVPVPPINRAGLDRALAYLRVFQRPGFKFGEWTHGQDELPHYQYSPEVDRFVGALYAANLVYPFDWGQFVVQAFRYRDEPGLLAKADLLTLRRLLTTHVRADRFNEGHLAAVLESGHINVILKRLQELRENLG